MKAETTPPPGEAYGGGGGGGKIEPHKLRVGLPPASWNGATAKLTPTRVAPPEPGYESVAPFRKTSIEGNDYYVGQSEHLYEEPTWPLPATAKAAVGKEAALAEEAQEEAQAEEEAGASASKVTSGYNKPVHPGSKHISTEQLDRLCNSLDHADDNTNNNDDDNDDENEDGDDDEDDDDVGYSRPLLQGSRARLYDDADDGGDEELHDYDEPYVETPQLLPNDAVDL